MKVLITGASNGIGRAAALLFAKKGYDIVAVGRDKEKLESLKEEIENVYQRDIEIGSYDLTVKENIKNVYNRFKNVDILVNNAGFGDHGEYLNSDYSVQEEMVKLNILSLMELTYLYGHDMKQKGKGRIINIASIAGLVSGPYMSIYYASKSFVLSFSEAVALEMKPYHIEVNCICPGPIRTGFMERVGLKDSMMFKYFKPLDSKTVAKKIVNNHHTVKFIGLSGYLLNVAVRILPRRIILKGVGLVNGRR